MRILVIEDQPEIRQNIADYLGLKGFLVDCAYDGLGGLHLAVTQPCDLIILDLMLPGMDGITLCQRLRQEARVQTPIIMLTARDSVDDKLKGFQAGADDYLVKPFAFGELSARIAALARRPRATQEETVLRAGDLEMDLMRRRVARAGQVIDLLPREFALLEHLLRRKGRVQTRTMLLEAVWDISFDPQTNVVETHVSRLRAKIDKPFETELIKTVRGAGYMLAPD